jgi:predicted dehydrogenase
VTAPHSVAVIGLGRVGATYGSPADKYPYCHVGGALRSDRTRLVAVADRSAEALERFAANWGQLVPDVRSYGTVARMLEHSVPDIVAVCLHEPDRHAEMGRILDAAPHAIFLEKPACCSLNELDHLMATATANATLVTVSYSRHWTPHILGLQRLVQDKLIGRVRQVVAYSPGERLLSFACHTIDLVCQFADYNPRKVEAIGDLDGNCRDQVPPGYIAEPSYEQITIEFENGVVGTIYGKAGPHEYWYCDVIGTEGTVRAGLYVLPAAFRPDGEPIELAPYALPPKASVFSVAYGEIAAALAGGPGPACSGADAIAVNEIGFAAIQSMRGRGPVEFPVSHRDLQVYASA